MATSKTFLKVAVLLILGLSHIVTGERKSDSTKQRKLLEEKDFRWPNRQLNVLVDIKSTNDTERQILTAIFDQIEHKTCIRVKRLSSNTVNPFDTRQLPETERNFIYLFKAQFGLSHSDHPPLGLSSFGCVNQGRQSMVLGDLAFRWPELVLKYHILRSLGVANLTRPDSEVRNRLNVLPMSQKIGDEDGYKRQSEPGFDPAPALFAYATFASLSAEKNRNDTTEADTISTNSTASYHRKIVPVEYLSEQDLNNIKDLYNCSDYGNRLSTKPLDEFTSGQLNPGMATNSKFSNFYSSSNNDNKLNTETASPPEDSNENTTIPNSTQNSNDNPISIPHHDAATFEPDSSIGNTDRMGQNIISETKIDDAAKSILNQLLTDEAQNSPGNRNSAESHNQTTSSSADLTSESRTTSPPSSGQCKPLESCPIDSIESQPQQQSDGDARTPASDQSSQLSDLEEQSGSQERPMMLKLDEFHAQDPQLQQANQMKLSQLNNNTIETYRLMDAADLQQQQQQFQLPKTTPSSGSKSEMLISFEQSTPTPGQTSDPVAILAGSQVLKLCSCTCQTMTPTQPNPGPQPLPTTVTPTISPTTTACPTTLDPWTSSPRTPSTGLPPTSPTEEPTTTELPLTTTTTRRITTTSEKYTLLPTELPPTDAPTENPITTTTQGSSNVTTTSEETTTMQWTTTMAPPTSITEPLPTTGISPTTTSETHQGGSIADNPCDQVQWVKPNKTVYASAKIVWDVDRANQNYFLCNNLVNGELIPGKTHGFSCKVGNEGRAYELHNFNVLTKPESVNLAWVQRSSGSFGKTNLPVIGGYSKGQDPLVVSRCMVRDENNDVITLIGYINSLGVGLFPFDDIQIECSQYDVLACVS